MKANAAEEEEEEEAKLTYSSVQHARYLSHCSLCPVLAVSHVHDTVFNAYGMLSR